MGAWSDAEDEMIKRLWASGSSATEISQELRKAGFVRSRNSVIGRVHRKGSARSGREPASQPDRDEVARRNGWMKGVIAKSVMNKPAPTLRVIVTDTPGEMAEAVSDLVTGLADVLRTPEAGGHDPRGRVSLMALSAGQCRAPKGEGQAGEPLFCGAPVRAVRQSYCEACHKAMHAPKPLARQLDKSFSRQAVRHGW